MISALDKAARSATFESGFCCRHLAMHTVAGVKTDTPIRESKLEDEDASE